MEAPILRFMVHRNGYLKWMAAPGDEIIVRPDFAKVIVVTWDGTQLDAFTETEMLLLPEPNVTPEGVLVIKIYRSDLEIAPRVPLNMKEEIDF